jgi:uncharacterized protein YjbI with pentapeptide repeats
MKEYKKITPGAVMEALGLHERYLENPNGGSGKRLYLEGHDLTVVDFAGMDLSHAMLSDALLDRCDFGDTNLAYANLSWVVCRWAHFTYGATLMNTDFTGARLTGSTFTVQKEISFCTFDNAILVGCNFINTILVNCSFKDADLTGVSFAGARLINCNLAGAKLLGANLVGAVLDGTSLDEAAIIDDVRFE